MQEFQSIKVYRALITILSLIGIVSSQMLITFLILNLCNVPCSYSISMGYRDYQIFKVIPKLISDDKSFRFIDTDKVWSARFGVEIIIYSQLPSTLDLIIL